MSWWKHEKLLHGGPYMTSTEHRIVFQRESIPIVFVPGIMGSRLKRGNARVWDPNDKWFMTKNYLNATPAYREEMLTSPRIEVDNRMPDSQKDSISSDSMKQQCGGYLGLSTFGYLPASQQQQILNQASADANSAETQGWGGIAWGFYGDFLQALAGQDWNPVDKVFLFPVYAIAYNWVQDNALSGGYVAGQIADIKEAEKAKGYICDKVIVISHSMGGLVSRAAMKLSGAEGNVFGAIHGAQPATGAPVAYRRIRAGTESNWNPINYAQARVLGETSAKVMPVLANSVGALELLPSALYKTNSGAAPWLTLTKNGTTLQTLPAGDPCSSIYTDQQSFLRLTYHAEYINPAKLNYAESPGPDSDKQALVQFAKNAKQAKAFHDSLKLKCHDITYSAWVGEEGLKTWDKVEYRFDRPYTAPVDTYDPFTGIPIHVDTNPSEGTGSDYWNGGGSAALAGYYTIQPPTGKGDGTVPVSSGAALKDQSKGLGQKLNFRVIESVEHSAFYNNKDVRDFTVRCIGELVKKQFNDRMGR